jgi:hypothetical protein
MLQKAAEYRRTPRRKRKVDVGDRGSVLECGNALPLWDRARVPPTIAQRLPAVRLCTHVHPSRLQRPTLNAERPTSNSDG